MRQTQDTPSVSEDSVMQALKIKTRPLHDQIEQVGHVGKIMGGTLTLEEYKGLIRDNYIFHWVLETIISEQLPEEQLIAIQFKGRRKIGYLYSDLIELGIVGQSAASSQVLLDAVSMKSQIQLSGLAQMLGAMYVIEGSTLGGAIIKKELAKNPLLAHKVSFYYYGCYGSAQGRMWKEFKDIMEAHINTPQQIAEAVKGAEKAFLFLNNIMSK